MQNSKRRIRVLIWIALLLAGIVIVCVTVVSQSTQNPYFFEKGITKKEYEGYIYPLSSREITETVTLKITELNRFQGGELYTLELEQLSVTDTEDMISMGRQYLGYFYVKDSQIYRLPVKDYSGFTEEQTQSIAEAIRDDEKSFLDMCHIVCSEAEVEDTVDDQGYHSGIKADGNKRIYYFYNEDTGGTKEYEKIVWEKEKGIVYYQCGAGNMLMHIEFGVNYEEVAQCKEKNQEKQDIIVSENVIEKVLLEKVPELHTYEEYIQKETNGQAELCIQIYEAMEIMDESLLKGGKYYPIYVGESKGNYNANWDWFYINQDFETIYWYDIVEGGFCSLEEWRSNDKYRKIMGNELEEKLTIEEALQLVFDYEYASWEHLVEVTFFQKDDVIGYKWLTENDMRSPMYLTISEMVTTTQGDTYGIVRLAKDIYGTSGVYYRTETYNEFAVNMTTGEIIEMRVYLEEGGWEYSKDYQEKVLGKK